MINISLKTLAPIVNGELIGPDGLIASVSTD